MSTHGLILFSQKHPKDLFHPIFQVGKQQLKLLFQAAACLW
jgi:hypothetical protein